jgi:hypothetical protein
MLATIQNRRMNGGPNQPNQPRQNKRVRDDQLKKLIQKARNTIEQVRLIAED